MRPLRTAIVLGLLVGMQGASSLAQVPKPDPLRGDGRVSEFYTWSGELSGPPGRLLRSEPLPATLGLANAARQERILYTSTDGIEGKSLITVSGALFIPKGAPVATAIRRALPPLRASSISISPDAPAWLLDDLDGF